MQQIIWLAKRTSAAALTALMLVAASLAILPSQPATANGGNGSVLTVSSITLPPELSSVATAKKILYKSTDANGSNVAVSGVVLTPKSQYRPSTGNRNTVAWAHGTEGMADKCAPSRHPNTFDASPSYTYYRDALRSYLVNGWTVSASDYQGLGTPGTPQYLVGGTEARNVIDSVRAARNLDPSLSNKWVASGHSQGGQATLFANEIASSYGRGLRLKGSVSIAPVSNLDILGAAVPGTPGNGYVVMALVGLAAVDSSVDVNSLLAQPAKDLLPVLDSGCWMEVLSAYSGLTAEQLLNGSALPQAVLDKLASYGNPDRQSPTAPILLVQGEADQTLPLEITQLLQSQLCVYNKPIQLTTYPGQDHDPVIAASLNDVAAYIQARFAGQPAPNNC
jgi:dipeptidyl aminopeptidase/acylaminoacyl peptidase